MKLSRVFDTDQRNENSNTNQSKCSSDDCRRRLPNQKTATVNTKTCGLNQTWISLEKFLSQTSHNTIIELRHSGVSFNISLNPSGVSLEAAYFGKPVIASRVGGIPEVVEEGETGILVAPNNPEELSKAILALCSNSILRKKMGKRAKVEAQTKFNATITLTQHLELYKKAVLVYGGFKLT